MHQSCREESQQQSKSPHLMSLEQMCTPGHMRCAQNTSKSAPSSASLARLWTIPQVLQVLRWHTSVLPAHDSHLLLVVELLQSNASTRWQTQRWPILTSVPAHADTWPQESSPLELPLCGLGRTPQMHAGIMCWHMPACAVTCRWTASGL